MSRAKQSAGASAAARVAPGMRLGLGTGSTVEWFLRALADRLRKEPLRVEGVPTSESTARLAQELGIALLDPADAGTLDLAVDGADEVSTELDLIKGGGGALLREKVVAASSRRFLVIVDEGKRVSRLGSRHPLPVEVVPFGLSLVERRVRELDAKPELRRNAGGDPFVTDNGNWILDLRFPGGIRRPPAALELDLDRIPGVVETGLFVGMADEVLVGHDDGSVESLLRPGSPAPG